MTIGFLPDAAVEIKWLVKACQFSTAVGVFSSCGLHQSVDLYILIIISYLQLA
jgi:hypothetical protein